MKNFLLLIVLFLGFFSFSNVPKDFIDINKNQIIGNKIEIENKSYDTVECAVVNGLNQIIARVKVGSFKTIAVDIGYEMESDVRVFYKTSLDYDWKYQAGKEKYSYPPRFVIESDY